MKLSILTHVLVFLAGVVALAVGLEAYGHYKRGY